MSGSQRFTDTAERVYSVNRYTIHVTHALNVFDWIHSNNGYKPVDLLFNFLDLLHFNYRVVMHN